MQKEEINIYLKEAGDHLTNELLPFWTTRMIDHRNGGYITHFDKDGNDTGSDEKSLISQARSVYTLSSAHRAGYGSGEYSELAEHGINFMINKMWDTKYGGFFWMMVVFLMWFTGRIQLRLMLWSLIWRLMLAGLCGVMFIWR